MQNKESSMSVQFYRHGKQEGTSSTQNSILDDVPFKSEDPSFLLQTQESPQQQ
jgi:hypothetical protein